MYTLILFKLTSQVTKTKPAIRKLANFNQKIRKIINQTIFETFGAIKDIKVLNKELTEREAITQKILDAEIRISQNNVKETELQKKQIDEKQKIFELDDRINKTNAKY